MGWPYQQKPPMGWSIDLDHPLSQGLVGFWLFNEGSGTKVLDLSGYGNHGTFVNNPTWVAGNFGSAVNFVNANPTPHITVSDKPLWDFGGQMTVIVSIKGVASTPNQPMIIGHDLSSFKWMLLLDSARKPRFYVVTASGTRDTGASADIYDGVEHQLVCVYNKNLSANRLKLYKDGVLWTFADGLAEDISAGDEGLHIGIHYNALTSGYTGIINYIFIYNRALSASEIALLYREPFCMFEDPNEWSLLGGYVIPPVGAAGIMTTNTGYWGPTF